ncbi:MAG TPA: methyl-accepting chemotaxis protein [Chthoniobacteraceae bacterium]|jgi:methyl-accepting chemotaxis protein|nr:methyl-accepting chemotaxis protein [Chthoniobacteraceae bacterium]
MTRLLRKLRLWQKIVLIIAAFVLPVGVLAFFTFQSFEENVRIALLEKDGTAFLRPAAELLHAVTEHRVLVQRYEMGEKDLQSEILAAQDQVDHAFAAVDQARQQYGAQLDYTPDGLQAHGRPRAWIEPMRAEWQAIKSQWSQLKADDSLAQHQQLIDDIQEMISHVGDTSTLSLDPALDSYYLMDVGVFALPPMQERLNGIVVTGLQILDPHGGDSAKLAGLIALVHDNDLPRIEGDITTSIRENPKSFGKSDSLDREVSPRFADCQRETKALLTLAAAIESNMGNVTASQFAGQGKRAGDACYNLWQTSFNELDILLGIRARYYQTRLFEAMAFAGAALIFATALAWFIIRHITVPLGRLTAAAKAAAHEGDLSNELHLGGTDEIAQLTQAFEAMTGRFRDVAGVAGQLADGDVHVSVKPLSAKDTMGHALARMVENLTSAATVADQIASGDLSVEARPASQRDVMGNALAKMIGNLSTLTGHVQKAAVVMNTSVTDIAATARQQQATTSEVAATTTEIGATSKEIYATSKELLKTVNEVTTGAEETANLANSGQSSLARMEDTMGLFTEAVGSINAKLAVLNEKAANINQVVTTITKVADQTNLLSLNAAIEAEKAGEYGRGFAVVATEIRRLADQTSVASFDIEQMVKEMQSAVAAGVMGMDKFGEQVRRGVNEVQQVSAHLAQIIQQVQALTPRFSAVHEGMQAQALGADQITQALSQLSEATQQTADSLRQSNLSIDQLHDASRGMLTSLDGFKLRAA